MAITRTVPQTGDVQTEDLPASSVRPTVFDEGEGDNPSPATVFDQPLEQERLPVPAVDRPIATQVMALATADPSLPPVQMMREETIAQARRTLDMGQEYGQRLQIAADRQRGDLLALTNLTDLLVRAGGPSADPATIEATRRAYTQVAERRIEDDAALSAEYEAVERIQSLLTQGDPVEAQVAMQLYTNGGAYQVIIDDMVKSFIVMQRIEELQAEHQNEWWVESAFNFVTDVIPFKSMFDVSGILDDAGIENDVTGFFNFFQPGTNISEQGQRLFDLNARDFAQAMAADGPVMRSLRANAGLFTDDAGAAARMLTDLQGISESDVGLQNAFGVIDIATAGIGGRVAKLTKALTRLGARSAAVARSAEALEELVAMGTKAATSRTGVTADEVIENLETAMQNTNGPQVPLAVDIMSHSEAVTRLQEDLPTLLASSRFSNETELVNAYTAAEETIRTQIGEGVKNVRFMEEDLATGRNAPWGRTLSEQGNRVYNVEVTVGRPAGGGFATRGAATNGVRRQVGGVQFETFQDESGQWFGRYNVNIREEGFVTAPLETPNRWFSFLRSSATTTDQAAHDKALAADISSSRFRRGVQERIKTVLGTVTTAERQNLDQIIKAGEFKERWFTDDELTNMWEGLTNTPVTDSVRNAYREYRLLNDLDYRMRDAIVYRAKAARGFETVEFKMGDTTFDFDAIIDESVNFVKGREYFDASSRTWRRGLTAEDVTRLNDEGYIRIRLDREFALDEGQVTKDILIRRSDLVRRRLRRQQLGYREGGHRMYEGQHFIKQALSDAKGRLLNPAVMLTDTNPNRLRIWAKAMNDAIDLYKAGVRDLTRFEEILDASKSLPSAQEFLDGVRKGNIGTKHPVEVVYDREMPKIYSEARDDIGHFVDMDESPLEGYYRTTGRMYYSKKGEHLRDFFDNPATTVYPWETLNKSLYNVSRVTGLTGYKDHILERFQRTYGRFLEIENLKDSQGLYKLATAPIRNAVTDLALRRKIMNEQGAIARILRFETGMEKTLHLQRRRAAEWVLGSNTKDGVRLAVSEWVANGNPVEFLRGAAFDAKLGLFNWGQFVIQSTTMLSAMALSPKAGLKGMALVGPLGAWVLAGAKHKANVLDLLAKRGVGTLGGFADEAEFKAFARMLEDTGTLEVRGDMHSIINQYGPNRVFGATSTVDSIRETGRMFFYSAEVMNRIVASRIAWSEAMEKGLRVGTSEFRDHFVGRADDYSFNMMQASAGRFQSGLLSIPTQFWAYSFRMMDAMFGNKFTWAQKRRLITSQIVLAGAAGVPLGEGLSAMYQEWTGEPINHENSNIAERVLNRGVVDEFIWQLTGADTQMGAKIGVGGQVVNIIRDFFAAGEYGPKSMASILAGATGSIVASVGETGASVITYAIAESGADSGFAITQEKLVNLGMEISTLNYATRAYLAYNYRGYQTKNSLTVSTVGPEDAFFLAMGLQPGELKDMEVFRNMAQTRRTATEDAVSQLRLWRQQAFTNPDAYQENMEKANMLTQMLPEDIRADVIRQVNRTTDPSLYDSMARRWQEEQDEADTLQILRSGTTEEGDDNAQ